MVWFNYNNGAYNLLSIYDAETSTTEFRRYENSTISPTTFNLPNTSYIGLKNVTNNGFELYTAGTTVTQLNYIAIG